ncbi:cell wall hydrolase [Maricaulis sp. D1M11]|uniref:cell wall hydrolase n=1 Tax=Maricaulis sp. D1M11 TaxID=3076117 RepID=UPI0039B4D677
MTSDMAENQATRMVTVIQTLTAGLLTLAMALALVFAADRAREQDETLVYQALALRYLEQGDVDEGWDAPRALQVASVLLVADQDGVSLEQLNEDYIRTFTAGHFRMASRAQAELDCLAEAVYYEARSELFEGQVAVAQVVLNRVRDRNFPSTICEVVYQGSERVTGCQFTFTCDGSLDRTPRGRSWRRAQMIAEHVNLGFAPDMTRRSTHYHTVAVDPYWNDSLVRTRLIGTHIFYRWPSRRERAAGIVDRDT